MPPLKPLAQEGKHEAPILPSEPKDRKIVARHESDQAQNEGNEEGNVPLRTGEEAQVAVCCGEALLQRFKVDTFISCRDDFNNNFEFSNGSSQCQGMWAAVAGVGSL